MPGAYENDFRYNAAGTGADVVQWSFTGLTPGEYRVAASWTRLGNRASNAPYTRARRRHGPGHGAREPGAGAERLQSSAARSWEELGTFTITARASWCSSATTPTST